jgi:hypothetical protein
MAFDPVSKSRVEICFVLCSHCEGWLGTRSCSTEVIKGHEITGSICGYFDCFQKVL